MPLHVITLHFAYHHDDRMVASAVIAISARSLGFLARNMFSPRAIYGAYAARAATPPQYVRYRPPLDYCRSDHAFYHFHEAQQRPRAGRQYFSPPTYCNISPLARVVIIFITPIFRALSNFATPPIIYFARRHFIFKPYFGAYERF